MASIRTETPTGSPVPESDTNKRKKPRVILYRNADGSYDMSSLSEEDKARLFGGSAAPPPPPPAAAEPAPEPINPALIGMALNLLTSIEAHIVAGKLGLESSVVAAALQPQPPIDTELTTVAARVVNKYGGTMGAYADEIALVALVATWQITAFSQLRALAAAKHTPTEAPPPHVDADRHQSPAPPPPPAKPEPVKPKADVSIDMLMGAHSATVTGGGV